MAARPPVDVLWIFQADDPLGHELVDLAAVLEMQGRIHSFSPRDVPAGQDVSAELARRMGSAQVVVLFDDCTLPTTAWAPPTRTFLGVLARVRAEAAWFQKHSVPTLPRDGEPLFGRANRREGLLDVIRGVEEAAERAAERNVVLHAEPGALTIMGGEARLLDVKSPAPTALVRAIAAPPQGINEIFQLNGPPSATFVAPPHFNELRLELQTLGTGLIVEGPSRVGKTTAVRKAMESVASNRQIWWDGKAPPPFEEMQCELRALQTMTEPRWLFIDDFHYLAENKEICRALAFAMKALADRGVSEARAKITLIGINPLGASLVQAMPDLAGRFRPMRLDIDRSPSGSSRVLELIVRGEVAANVSFVRRDQFVLSADGSFYLAQLLCNKAAIAAGVTHRPQQRKEIDLGPAAVIQSIQGELAARYRSPLLELAAFDKSTPPRGAGITLLWMLSRASDGFLPVREASLRFPALAEAFEWFLESNLSRCFTEHPALRGLLYYNRSAGTLSLEDPLLKFYLRQLDWEELARASGHGVVAFHDSDGPRWPTPGSVQPSLSVHVAQEARHILHLSDLHFSQEEQATIWYSQLSSDLRSDLGVEKLHGLIISGDIANRSEPKGYDGARLFLEKLMAGFGVERHQLVLVPGNHDVSRTASKSAYTLLRKDDIRQPLVPGRYKTHGEDAVEVREDAKYGERFRAFADFYSSLKGADYPLDANGQATLDAIAPDIMILGLNSAWQIDHLFPSRAEIHPEALATALNKLGPPSAAQLRIAVFHHPVQSDEEARIKDTAFLERLAVAGFRVALHGHVHKHGVGQDLAFRYDRSAGGRRVEVIAAGTFGAPTRELVSGYPFQYNLLSLDEQGKLLVHTRKRESENGAWSPDARWTQGAGKDPLPRYEVDLQNKEP